MALRRCYLPDFVTAALRSEFLEAVESFSDHQLSGPKAGRYIYKAVQKGHFLAFGTRHVVKGQEIFVWLRALHRNDPRVGWLLADPKREGAALLEPLLEQKISQIEEWMEGEEVKPAPPDLPGALEPWFRPLSFTHGDEGDSVQIFETGEWLAAFAKPDIRDYWSGWGTLLTTLCDNLSVGKVVPGFSLVRHHSHKTLHALYLPMVVERHTALLLIAASRNEAPTVDPALRKSLEVLEGMEGEVSLDELAQLSQRSWPSYLLADDDVWRELARNSEGNLALSSEEKAILAGILNSQQTQHGLPLFVNGQAGSGKSTLLCYVFAHYAATKWTEGWEGEPLYVATSPTLIKRARSTIEALLRHNTTLRPSSATPLDDERAEVLDGWISTTRELYQGILGNSSAGASDRVFGDQNHVDFHRFRRLYLGHGLDSRETPHACRWQTRDKVPPELAWYVIRAFIKGYDPDSYLAPGDFRDLPHKDRTLSDDRFLQIHDHVWTRWYKKLTDGKAAPLWDDQDLVRAALGADLSAHTRTLICCDEAQDLTRIEARLLYRLSIASGYPLNPSRQKVLPFMFAGDPLQTIHPSGFRWAALKSLLTDQISGEGSYSQTAAFSLNARSLTHNYRSSATIVKLLNRVQAWRVALFGLGEVEPQRAWKTAGLEPKLWILDEDIDTSRLNEHLTHTTIIVSAEDGGEEAYCNADPALSRLSRTPGTPPHNVYSAAAAKGLEFSTVVVYCFGHQAPARVWDADEHDRRAEVEHFWNKLYVALSRATEHLFVIDTKEGVRRFWDRFLEETGGRPPLDAAAQEQWAPDLGWLERGLPNELGLLSQVDRSAIARDLKKAGEEQNNPTHLRRAQSYYQSLEDTHEARKCEALALDAERRYEDAGRIWRMLGDNSRAEDSFWRGEVWNELAGPRLPLRRERRVVASFLSQAPPEGTPGDEAHHTFAAILDDSLEVAIEWLERGGQPTPGASQWASYVKALERALKLVGEERTPESSRGLATRLERLGQAGLNTWKMAALAYNRAREWHSAIRCWDQGNDREHTHYYLAKAEVTQGPEHLKWLDKAHHYKRLIEAWSKQQDFEDEGVLKLVEKAYKSEGRYRERILLQLRRNRGGDRAADDLTNYYPMLKPQERGELTRAVCEALARRQRWETLFRLREQLPAQEQAEEERDALRRSIEMAIARELLRRLRSKAADLHLPQKERAAFLELIDSKPERMLPDVGSADLLILLLWLKDKEDVKLPQDALRRHLEDPSSPLHEEAQSHMRKQAGETHGSSAGTPTAPAKLRPRREARQRPTPAPRREARVEEVQFEAIEQLRLLNFRAFENACLSLDPLTVLIGQNGAGKSSLRLALEVLREALTNSLSNALDGQGGLQAMIRQSGKLEARSLVLSAQLRVRIGEERRRVVYGFELLKDEDGGYRLVAEHLGSDSAELPGFHREGTTFSTAVGGLAPVLGQAQLALPLVAGSHPLWSRVLHALQNICTYSLAPEKIAEVVPAQEQRALLSRGENAPNILKSLETHHRAELDAVLAHLRVVANGLKGVRTDTLRGKRSLVFEQEGERKISLDPTQVSEGTLRTLGILLALYQQPAPSLIFLEELEDSIHPHALNTLMEAIHEVSTRTQVVITSHSPSALTHTSVTEACTRLIRWELGRSEIYHLESQPLEPGDLPFAVGELLRFNALSRAALPSTVRGNFFEVDRR